MGSKEGSNMLLHVVVRRLILCLKLEMRNIVFQLCKIGLKKVKLKQFPAIWDKSSYKYIAFCSNQFLLNDCNHYMGIVCTSNTQLQPFAI